MGCTIIYARANINADNRFYPLWRLAVRQSGEKMVKRGKGNECRPWCCFLSLRLNADSRSYLHGGANETKPKKIM